MIKIKSEDKKTRYFSITLLFLVICTGLALPSSLKAARLKSKNARIISEMSQLRSVAELIYSEKEGFANLEIENEHVSKINEDIVGQGSKLIIEKASDGSGYCAYAPLVDYSEPVWHCIDADGQAITTTIDPGSGGNCDGTTFHCPGKTGEIPPRKEERKERIFEWIWLTGSSTVGLLIITLALWKRFKRQEGITEDSPLIKKELKRNFLFYFSTVVLVILTELLTFFYVSRCIGDLCDILGPFLMLSGFLAVPFLTSLMLYRMIRSIRKLPKEEKIVCWEAYTAPFLLGISYFFLVLLAGESSQRIIRITQLIIISGASLSLASIIHKGKLNKIIGGVLLFTFLFPLIFLSFWLFFR